MASVNWTPRAREEFESAVRYMARDSRTQAETFALRVLDAVDRLTVFPQSGRTVPELRRSEIREIIVRNYRVVYRVNDDGVQILSVYHGARLLRTIELLEEDGSVE